MTASYRASTTATSAVAAITFTDPGLSPDFLVCVIVADDVSKTWTLPDATWRKLYTENLNAGGFDGSSVLVAYKDVSDGGGASFTFTCSSAMDQIGIMLAYKDARGINAFSHATGTLTPLATDWNIPATGITPLVDDSAVLWIATGSPQAPGGPGTWTPPSGYTQRDHATGFDDLCVSDIEQTTATATGTVTGVLHDLATNLQWSAFLLSISPFEEPIGDPLITQQGSFSTGTGAAASTVVVSGLTNFAGLLPKAILFWWSGRTDTSDAVGRQTHCRGFGVGVSSSSRHALSTTSQDAVATGTAISWQDSRDTACVTVVNTVGALLGSLDFTSMNVNGFTMTVGTQFTSSRRIHFLAIGGDDITGVARGSFTETATAANKGVDYTGFGLKPDAAIFMSIAAGGSPGAGAVDSRIGIGFAAGPFTDCVTWTGGNNSSNAAATQTANYCLSGEAVAILDATVVSPNSRGKVTSFNTDGLTMLWPEVGSTGRVYFYLALRGGRYKVGKLTTLTNTTTDIEVATGFTPTGGVFISSSNAEDAVDTADQNDRWSMGAFDQSLGRGSMATFDRDNVATTEVSNAVRFASVYANISTASAIQGEMDVTRLNGDGFVARMTTADAANNFVGWLAFGSAFQIEGTRNVPAPEGPATKGPRRLFQSTFSRPYSSGVIPSNSMTVAGVMDGLVGAAALTETFVISSAAGLMSGLTASAVITETIRITSAAGVLPGLTAAATMTETFVLTTAAVLPGLTASATLTETDPMTIAAVLPGLTAAATVTETFVISVAAGVLPGLTAAAAMAESFPFTAAGVMDGLVASAAALAGIRGPIAGVMDGLVADAVMLAGIRGPIAGVLDGLVARAEIQNESFEGTNAPRQVAKFGLVEIQGQDRQPGDVEIDGKVT